jgi:hypothetical protein
MRPGRQVDQPKKRAQGLSTLKEEAKKELHKNRKKARRSFQSLVVVGVVVMQVIGGCAASLRRRMDGG